MDSNGEIDSQYISDDYISYNEFGDVRITTGDFYLDSGVDFQVGDLAIFDSNGDTSFLLYEGDLKISGQNGLDMTIDGTENKRCSHKYYRR